MLVENGQGLEVHRKTEEHLRKEKLAEEFLAAPCSVHYGEPRLGDGDDYIGDNAEMVDDNDDGGEDAVEEEEGEEEEEGGEEDE